MSSRNVVLAISSPPISIFLCNCSSASEIQFSLKSSFILMKKLCKKMHITTKSGVLLNDTSYLSLWFSISPSWFQKPSQHTSVWNIGQNSNLFGFVIIMFFLHWMDNTSMVLWNMLHLLILCTDVIYPPCMLSQFLQLEKQPNYEDYRPNRIRNPRISNAHQ